MVRVLQGFHLIISLKNHHHLTTRQVDDKRLRIDISAIKESFFFKNEIQSTKWCPGASQLANPLKKKGAQSNLLLHTIQKVIITF